MGQIKYTTPLNYIIPPSLPSSNSSILSPFAVDNTQDCINYYYRLTDHVKNGITGTDVGKESIPKSLEEERKE